MKANFLLAGLAAAAVLSLSCSKKSTNPGGGSGFASTPNISMQGNLFVPQRDSVAVGTIVTWTNNDPANHTVTSNSGTELFSQTIPPGQTYVDTMNTPGIFDYHCNFHGGMTGTIKVQ